MKNLLIIILSCLLLVSCREKYDKKNELLLSLATTLERSTTELSAQNSLRYDKAEDELADPCTRGMLERLYPTINAIRRKAEEIYLHLGPLKKAAISDTAKPIRQAPFLSKDALRDIALILRNFEDSIAQVNEGFVSEFGRHPLAFERSLKLLDQASSIETFALLAQIENRVRSLEGKLVSFTLQQFANDCIFEYWDVPVVSISSLRAHPGDSIEITAGIGQLINGGEVILAGKSLRISEGKAVYHFKAASQTGRHSLHLTFKYRKRNGGGEVTMEKEIYYQVVQ